MYRDLIRDELNEAAKHWLFLKMTPIFTPFNAAVRRGILKLVAKCFPMTAAAPSATLCTLPRVDRGATVSALPFRVGHGPPLRRYIWLIWFQYFLPPVTLKRQIFERPTLLGSPPPTTLQT